MSLLFPKCPQIFSSHESFVANFFQPHQNTARPFLLPLYICVCSYCHVEHPHLAEVLPFTLAHHCGHLVDDECTKPQVMKGRRNYGAQVIVLLLYIKKKCQLGLKWKGFVADIFSVAKIVEFIFERVENIVVVTSVFSNSHNFIPPQNEHFRGYTGIVCLSIHVSVCLCTKYYFLSKHWRGYQVTFSFNSILFQDWSIKIRIG